MTHPSRRLASTAMMALTFAFASAAHAQPDAQPPGGDAATTAADHAKRGQVAYDLQDWATAISEYESAYRLEQKSEYLWALAQAQRQSGDHAGAIKSYKSFQRAGVSASQANAAEMMMLKSEAELAKAELAETKKQAAAQNERPPAGTTEPSSPASTGPSEKKPKSDMPQVGVGWFIAGSIITVGLGAATIWSGVDTLGENSDYEANPTEQGYLDGRDLTQRTDILLGATVIVGAATLVFAVFTDWSGDSDEPAQGRVRVAPLVAENAGALVLTGDF